MKNIKYFLALGIILTSSIAVLTGCGKKDTKEETTTINILGSSPQKTDEKNADELVAQLQNCISDYEFDTDTYLISAGGDDIIIEWNSEDVTDNNIENERFKELVEKCLTSYSESKAKKGSFPKATISLKDSDDPKQGYNITVELGDSVAKR